jgi:hypothetical protein
MTILLERPATGATENPAEMSAVDRRFDSKEEVRTMTATTARPRPHGLDRAVMRLSLAMMIWARKRAERSAMTHSQRGRQVSQARAIEAREHDAALRFARVR